MITHQAVDSVTKAIYTWTAETYDSGTGYPGPNTATNVVVIGGIFGLPTALPGFGVPVTVGETNAAGSAATLARSDHVHALPPLNVTVGVGEPVDVGLANAEGTSENLVRQDHVHKMPFSVLYSLLSGAQQAIPFNGQRVISVGEPTQPTDATTKQYVDSVAQGLKIKDEVFVVAAVGNIDPATAGLGTYVDSTVVDTDGQRVLLTDQTSAIENGIWVAHETAWTRPTDFDTGDHAAGAYVHVTSGTEHAGSSWVCNTSASADVIDTNALNFAEFSSAAQIAAGTGLVKDGNTLSLDQAWYASAGEHVPGLIYPGTGVSLVWDEFDGLVSIVNSLPAPAWGASGGSHQPAVVAAGQFIALTWDAGTQTVTIATNQPIAQWYASSAWHTPTNVNTGRGVELTWDTDTVTIQTNFPVPSFELNYTDWSTPVTIASGDTSKTLTIYTWATNIDLANTSYLYELEVEVVLYRENVAGGVSRYIGTQAYHVKYNGSGVAAVTVMGDADSSTSSFQGHEPGGMPTFTGMTMAGTAGPPPTATTVLTKNSGGNAVSAKWRVRPRTVVQI